MLCWHELPFHLSLHRNWGGELARENRKAICNGALRLDRRIASKHCRQPHRLGATVVPVLLAVSKKDFHQDLADQEVMPMHLRFRLTGLFLIVLLVASLVHAEDWSRFRGPNGSGISNDTGFPTEFGPGKNLVWKSSVRLGKSSPVLTAKHLFLTGHADDKLYTQCFDRQTGKLLWERSIDRQRKPLIHKLNEPAAITPVTDGLNVYVFFPDFGLLSYDGSGKLRWQRPLGPFTNAIGLSSSPILVDGRLILQVDQYVDAYIAAFNPDTGETLWKTRSARNQRMVNTCHLSPQRKGRCPDPHSRRPTLWRLRVKDWEAYVHRRYSGERNCG